MAWGKLETIWWSRNVILYQIREMVIEDYEALIVLFRETPGITVRDADSQDATSAYLKRNPGLSFVAIVDEKIVGCVMSGHDGRRGYLQHLIVTPEFRKLGIGKALYSACLSALQDIGIYKTHLFVQKTNTSGEMFWKKQGCVFRDEVLMFSFNTSPNENI